jgi:hypothetical protein
MIPRPRATAKPINTLCIWCALLLKMLGSGIVSADVPNPAANGRGLWVGGQYYMVMGSADADRRLLVIADANRRGKILSLL